MEQNNSNNSSQPSTLVFSISSNDNTNPLLAKSKEVTGTYKRKKNTTEEEDLPPNKKSWSKDHATPDGKCSDDVLLEWLTEPGNFQRYRGIGDLVNRGTGGGGPTGEGSILNEEIDPNDSGDNTNNAQDSITDIKGQVKRIFKYYYELEAVMGDTHSSNPLYLSESIHLPSPSTLPLEAQVSELAASTSAYRAAADSAVNELNKRDDDDFINEEVVTNDMSPQSDQNQQSPLTTHDGSPHSKNKSGKQIKKNPIAQIIWDINQYNSKYFEEGLAIKQNLVKQKHDTDQELLGIKREKSMRKKRETLMKEREIRIKEREVRLKEHEERRKESETRMNIIKTMAAAGFSADAIQKELSRDSEKEKEYRRLYNDEKEGIESEDDNISLDSVLEAVVDRDEEDAGEDVEGLESEDNQSDDESVIIMENQQRGEEYNE
ncbi:hypothetical protein INT45_002996 [Circinella minor]|uniref:Uncharacterized protein n=1 Tax=Circinella minor TaxID=1195481 RepID=A0A8H7VHW5_9FUNG|nr:hypothetical protein INT45_002996 [Circinella minor]